jgi:hypothetical protein
MSQLDNQLIDIDLQQERVQHKQHHHNNQVIVHN